MASCASCGGRMQTNKSNGLFANKINQILSYSDEDFVTMVYIGETGNYVGMVSYINYGYKTTNQRMMILKIDLEEDKDNFIENIEQNSDINLSFVQPKKNRKSKKEVQEIKEDSNETIS